MGAQLAPGDARATQMGRPGNGTSDNWSVNGTAVNAVLIGFTTYTGTVTAASDWGGPAERKRVRPAIPEVTMAIP